MKERMIQIRKALGMTQQTFADRLGVKRNTIAQYEIGRNPPTGTVITLLVREFGVNEKWLRAGEGEMFIKKSRDDEIAAFLGSVMSDADESFRKRLISVLSRMSVEEWELLERKARELTGE